jgi:16S rRNA (guanine966-N2)-methyltransferase
MRITGGTLKGYHLPARFASHVRPTTDMVRESVFNKLQHTIGIEAQIILDLFAGSGVISLECLSRGAASVTSVDKDSKNTHAMQQIRKEKNLEHWEIMKADVFAFLRKETRHFDIIFADPPYDLTGIQEIPTLAMPLLAEDGLLLVEHRPGTAFHIPPTELRTHGSTAIAIFAKVNTTTWNPK